MVIAITITSAYRPVGHIRSYLTSFLIWSSLGFVVSTVIYAIVLVVSAKFLVPITEGNQSIAGGVFIGTIVFIAPFIAAGVGLIGGGVFGLWKRMKTITTRPNQEAQVDSQGSRVLKIEGS